MTAALQIKHFPRTPQQRPTSIEGAHPKLKVGDRVDIRPIWSRHHGCSGTVRRVFEDRGVSLYTVQPDGVHKQIDYQRTDLRKCGFGWQDNLQPQGIYCPLDRGCCDGWMPKLDEQIDYLHFDIWRRATVIGEPDKQKKFYAWEVRLDSGSEVYVFNILEMRRLPESQALCQAVGGAL